MGFKGIMAMLLAGAVGLVVFTSTSGEVADGKDFAEGATNSPSEGTTGSPSLRDFAAAVGIVIGANGEMHKMGGPSDARLVTDPEKTRKAEFYGWKVEHPGLIGPDDEFHLVQSALADMPGKRPVETPAEIVERPSEPGCTAPARAPDEKLAKVQVVSGSQPSGYHAVTDRDLAEGAKAFIRKLQRAADPADERPSGDTRPVSVVNVVLTDESASLYLVLQAASQPILWNLHATPGVEVARIVVVGNPGNAVHPPDPATPVNFLDIAADCAPQPWRAAQPWWDMYHGPGADSGDFEEKSAARHLAYEEWFAETFGEPSEPGTIGAFETSHVLVGPLPASAETRAPYRPLTGARIVAHAGPLLYAAPARDREADIAARRHTLAVAAAGGDLSIVNPRPMERAE